MSKLEAFCVSTSYVDFLEKTLSRNIAFFDTFFVITKPEDKETIDFCLSSNFQNLRVIATNAFNAYGAEFNKGECFNVGFSLSEHRDWMLTIDSDIILPPNFREDFLREAQNKEYFYGCRRRNFETWQTFLDFEQGKKDINPWRGSGYGFCSAWNHNSKIFQKLLRETNNHPYPYWFKNGSESDWVLRNFFGERVFNPPLGKFPECHSEPNCDYDTGLYKELSMIINHLGFPGLNHNNRITPKFE